MLRSYFFLGENELCAQQVFIGGPPPPEICGENFICYEQKCQKKEIVMKKIESLQ